MSKKALRRIEVEGQEYLWRIWHHTALAWSGWDATLRVYSAHKKSGWLEVRYESEDRYPIFPSGQSIRYKWTNEDGLNVHEPKTIVRVIRYAQKQLGWQAETALVPLVIKNGYQLLHDMGYEAYD